MISKRKGKEREEEREIVLGSKGGTEDIVLSVKLGSDLILDDESVLAFLVEGNKSTRK